MVETPYDENDGGERAHVDPYCCINFAAVKKILELTTLRWRASGGDASIHARDPKYTVLPSRLLKAHPRPALPPTLTSSPTQPQPNSFGFVSSSLGPRRDKLVFVASGGDEGVLDVRAWTLGANMCRVFVLFGQRVCVLLACACVVILLFQDCDEWLLRWTKYPLYRVTQHFSRENVSMTASVGLVFFFFPSTQQPQKGSARAWLAAAGEDERGGY